MSENDVSPYKICYNTCLGQGSFSKVYLGYHVADPSQQVAIKIINMESSFSIKLRDKIVDEIRILSILRSHPHASIIHCHKIVQLDHRVYIVMDYCRGGELSKMMGQLDPYQIKRYFGQMVSGLLHLKSLNIMHRDIKPSNIMLTEDKSQIKITDFGLAKLGAPSMHDTMCGSPYYMAPEILNELKYDQSADVWSLGVVLYEMVHSKRIYNNVHDIKDLIQAVNSLNINLPISACNDLLQQMLNKDPAARIALEMIEQHPWMIKSSLTCDGLDTSNKLDANTDCGRAYGVDPFYSFWSHTYGESSVEIIHHRIQQTAATAAILVPSISSHDFDQVPRTLPERRWTMQLVDSIKRLSQSVMQHLSFPNPIYDTWTMSRYAPDPVSLE